jgi:hypothetical protein
MSSCFVTTICIKVADPFSLYTDQLAEIEFLDTIFKKIWSLLLHAIQSPFYWRILKKTILFSGFKNRYQTIHEKRKLESIHE